MSTQIDLGPVLSVPKGDWNATTTYERLNLVRHNSASWICNVATSKGVEPTEDSADWYLQVKDISSVTSVNGMKGDVVIELTETETPPANDNSNRIATTEWVTDKLGDVDLSGIKDDTVLAAQNASSLEVGTGELTSAELATIIDNNDSALRAFIAEEVAKCLKLSGGNLTGALKFGNVGAVYHSTSTATDAMNFGFVEEATGRGAIMSLRSPQATDAPGSFWLGARSATAGDKYLTGRTDGWLGWMGNRIISTQDIYTLSQNAGSVTLPAGGSWAFFLLGRSGTSTWVGTGVKAGGTVIDTGMADTHIIAIRIS